MGPALVVRTRPGSWMLLRAPFGSSFVSERPVLTLLKAFVVPAPVGGCSGDPLCSLLKSLRRDPLRLLDVTQGPIRQQFCFEGTVLTS